jgi:hypothetical protein
VCAVIVNSTQKRPVFWAYWLTSMDIKFGLQGLACGQRSEKCVKGSHENPVERQ